MHLSIHCAIIAALTGTLAGHCLACASQHASAAAIEATDLSPLSRLSATCADLPAFKDQSLSTVWAAISDASGVHIDVMWQDDAHAIGLDPHQSVTLDPRGMTYLSAIERILAQAVGDSTGSKGNTWQFTEGGELQVGPRERLEKFLRVATYDINDLLLVIPDFTNAPDFDLNSVLQSGGSGAIQSPFATNPRGSNDAGPDGKRAIERSERAKTLEALLMQLCEPSAWADTGEGTATMRYYQGTLIVNAPDFVHRALNGTAQDRR